MPFQLSWVCLSTIAVWPRLTGCSISASKGYTLDFPDVLVGRSEHLPYWISAWVHKRDSAIQKFPVCWHSSTSQVCKNIQFLLQFFWFQGCVQVHDFCFVLPNILSYSIVLDAVHTCHGRVHYTPFPFDVLQWDGEVFSMPHYKERCFFIP